MDNGDWLMGQRLLALIESFDPRRESSTLARALEEHWSSECIAPLLRTRDPRVAAAAITALFLIGEETAVPALVAVLSHESPSLVDSAERALWSIWFRSAGPTAQAVLTRIAATLQRGENENTVPMLTELVRAFPRFAEAFHQRALAHYLQGSFASCLRDASRTLQLCPFHFSGQSLRGHALAALGRRSEALSAYRASLRIHPRFHGVRAAIMEIGTPAPSPHIHTATNSPAAVTLDQAGAINLKYRKS